MTFEELQEKLQQLQTQYEKDCLWDETNATDKVSLMASVISRYQRVYYSFLSIIKKHEAQLDVLWQQRYVYYKMEYEHTLKQTEIKEFISTDVEYNDAKLKIEYMKNICTYL